MDKETTSFENPKHPVPDEVAEGLRLLREEEHAEFVQQNELARQSRPTEDERRSITEIYDQAAQALGIDIEKLRGVHREIGENRFARVEEGHKRVDPIRRELIPLDLEPPPPDTARADHSFSFFSAHADRFPGGLGTMEANLAPDGWHLRWDLSDKSGNLQFARLNFVAAFELHADRVPHSVTGVWRSAPYVELFGRLGGWTDPPRIFGGGDSWSKCWMNLDHRILQFIPGGTFPLTIAQANEVKTLLHEEDKGRFHTVNMPGYQPMPQMRFGSFRRDISLIAHIGIHFDIQLEGGLHASQRTNPEILVRTFEWPLQPDV